MRAYRHAFEILLAALAGVNAVEIKRQRIDKLQLLVVLEYLALVQPAGRLRIARKLALQPFLPLDLPIEHPIDHRAVCCGDLIEQYQFGKAVATIVQPPAVHA